jgi:hypothetical protein
MAPLRGILNENTPPDNIVFGLVIDISVELINIKTFCEK